MVKSDISKRARVMLIFLCLAAAASGCSGRNTDDSEAVESSTNTEQSEPDNCVGTSDGIASYRTKEERIRQIQAQGTDAEIEVFDGLPHGFGLGEGTIAEGWLDNAADFWDRQMD